VWVRADLRYANGYALEWRVPEPEPPPEPLPEPEPAPSEPPSALSPQPSALDQQT
jgi:hypothetical protein